VLYALPLRVLIRNKRLIVAIREVVCIVWIGGGRCGLGCLVVCLVRYDREVWWQLDQGLSGGR
jgi:hypothetical protein